MQARIASALECAGFRVDDEDAEFQILIKNNEAWRYRSLDGVYSSGPSGRPRIDLVVYQEGDGPVALIEVESDLNHLQRKPQGRSEKKYDVFSLASSDVFGRYFYSYLSLERMAVAAYKLHLQRVSQADPIDLSEYCKSICSTRAEHHNPLALPLILVAARCEDWHREMLKPRLQSLGAKLICATDHLV